MSTRQNARCQFGLYLFPEEGWMDGKTASWNDVKRMAQAAEIIGFDTVWLPDRLTHVRDGEKRGVWESMTMLAAIAATTTQIGLGHAVLRSIYRNPALLAKMCETVDEISNGRFIFGIGAGGTAAPPKADNYSFGFPTDASVSRFEEALYITLNLLKKGTASFEGKYYQAHDCTLQPRGPRLQGPSVFIAARGPKMMQIAARHADIWGVPVLSNTPAGYSIFESDFELACNQVGRNPSDVTKMVIVGVNPFDRSSKSARNPYGESLAGTPEEIAEALHKFSQAGYRHIMLTPYPNTLAAIERCAPILEACRRWR